MNAFADRNGAFYSLIMAASVSAIVPLLVVFILGQKQVIEGISLGGEGVRAGKFPEAA